VAGAGADAGDTAGEAGQQQARGLERDTVETEHVLPARAVGGLPGQNRVGGKERGEHDDVADQEDPEAVGYDDALGGEAELRMLASRQAIRPVADTDHVASRGVLGDAHGAAPSWASAARRALRFSRSMRATSAAGMRSSVRSRHAKTTKVA